jgi:uncharacterized glyoxalase superfamily protein PhnB
MKKRPPRQSGYAWISPHIIVNDVDAAMKFYQKAFGFEKKGALAGTDGILMHASLTYQGQTIMLGRAGERGSPINPPTSSKVSSPMSLYVYCDDVDQFYHNAVSAGAKSISDPEDMFWGDRVCRLQDPDGYIWSFATNVGELDTSNISY